MVPEKYLDALSVAFMSVTAAVTALVVILTDSPSAEAPAEAGLTFTEEERALVESADSVMRVLTVTDSLDVKVLRAKSSCLSDADLESDTFARLAELMLATVTSPEQDGVGIAAPQVGLNRRVVAVQRFDKEGEPFEVYPNIKVDSLYGEPVLGPEGCLSVPGMMGKVLRYPDIIVSYTDIGTMQTVRDTVSGFTAVIFQHETDHLDGILYTDKAEEVIPL